MNFFKRILNLFRGKSKQEFICLPSMNHQTGIVLFHGGCHGCTMQKKEGLGYCTGCRYFEANWSLPDLNDTRKEERMEKERIRDIARRLAKSS